MLSRRIAESHWAGDVEEGKSVHEGTKKMNVNLPESLTPIAVKVFNAYRAGLPVVILAKDGSVLHGAEELQGIIDTGARLDALVIPGVERQEFEGCDLPEFCEAARMVWLDDSFPAVSA
jgi:hypothetical protein